MALGAPCYLDYCGSPPKRTAFALLYAALPRLAASAYDCRRRRALAAPPTGAFAKQHTFDHDKVVCDMYVRRAEQTTTSEPAAPAAKAKRGAAQRHRAARRLVGVVVAIPRDFWPNGHPGAGFADVQRRDDSLLFRVTKTYYGTKCALCAVLADGQTHRTPPERFWLTPVQAAALATGAPAAAAARVRALGR